MCILMLVSLLIICDSFFVVYIHHVHAALSPRFENDYNIISFNIIAFFVYVCMSCYRKLHLIIIIFAIVILACIVTVEARN